MMKCWQFARHKSDQTPSSEYFAGGRSAASKRDAQDHDCSRHRRSRLHRRSYRPRAAIARGEEVIGIDNLNDYYSVKLKRARLDWIGARRGISHFMKIDIADHERAFSAAYRRAQKIRSDHSSRGASRGAIFPDQSVCLFPLKYRPGILSVLELGAPIGGRACGLRLVFFRLRR